MSVSTNNIGWQIKILIVKFGLTKKPSLKKFVLTTNQLVFYHQLNELINQFKIDESVNVERD